MKWPKWSISRGRGDFLPIVIGCILVLTSLPAFVMLLWKPDRNSGIIGTPLLFILGFGIITGIAFIVVGIRLCVFPGSLAYRIAHGRFFSR